MQNIINVISKAAKWAFASPAIFEENINRDHVIKLIENVKYDKRGGVTICEMTVKSGFVIIGTSGSMYDDGDTPDDIGIGISYEDAVSKLWELEAYTHKHNEWVSNA